MKTLPAEPKIFDFNFPRLDTQLKVEVWNDGVSIRATRDSFTVERKDSFIRELASEGFISDDYGWCSSAARGSPSRRIRWFIDPSLVGEAGVHSEQTRRIATMLSVPAAVMMAILVGLVSTGHVGNFRPGAGDLIGGRGQHYVDSRD
jgi:hypothetical protein